MQPLLQNLFVIGVVGWFLLVIRLVFWRKGSTLGKIGELFILGIPFIDVVAILNTQLHQKQTHPMTSAEQIRCVQMSWFFSLLPWVLFVVGVALPAIRRALNARVNE